MVNLLLLLFGWCRVVKEPIQLAQTISLSLK
jgi:hypothetical protein